MDVNDRSGCLAGGVVRKIEGWSEEARQGYGAKEEETRVSPLQVSGGIFTT